MVSHLVEQEEHPDKNSYWTRVFSRDTEEGLQISIHKLGPDLIYDRSVREALSQSADSKEKFLFSPFMFTAEQMVTDLAQKKLSFAEFMELGKLATNAKARFTKNRENELDGGASELQANDIEE